MYWQSIIYKVENFTYKIDLSQWSVKKGCWKLIFEKKLFRVSFRLRILQFLSVGKILHHIYETLKFSHVSDFLILSPKNHWGLKSSKSVLGSVAKSLKMGYPFFVRDGNLINLLHFAVHLIKQTKLEATLFGPLSLAAYSFTAI